MKVHRPLGMPTLRSGTSLRVELFEYPASARSRPVLWEGLSEVGTPGSLSDGEDYDGHSYSDSESRQPSPVVAAEIAPRSFEEGREQGIQEARETAAEEKRVLLQDADKRRVEIATDLAGKIADGRERFLHELEPELIRLSLAIAARILRREAQMDPLFLIGAVRVALGQLAATMQVRLRVPSAESDLWTETMKHIPNLKVKSAVVADDSMQLGDCRIETEMGSVDLGLFPQLHQMEMALLEGVSATTTDASAFPLSPEREIER
jgi:flagellar biosynthesis/type III secretory pathway protein FliH